MSFSLRIALSICEEISVKLFSTNITGIVLAPKIGVGFSCALKKKKKKKEKKKGNFSRSLWGRRGIGNPHATMVQDIFGRFSKTEKS